MGKPIKISKLERREQPQERVSVHEAVLEEALASYERGQYVDAYHRALKAGPLDLWQGAKEQTFGYRLAGNLGAGRLASLLICRARHEDRQSAEAAVHYGFYLQQRRGPLPAWRHCMAAESMTALTPVQLSDFKAMRAVIAAGYRDFDTAWQLWHEAVAVHEPSAWLQVEKCSILASEERREEALEALDEALVLRPWFRPAVQFRARMLHLLGRREEAVDFLTAAMGQMQSCAIAAQLMALKREDDDHAGMEELADAYEKLAVLSEADSREWLAARRVDLLTLRGDFKGAAVFARGIQSDYYHALAKRLEAPDATHVRERLPFEFVHQKHNTCAPATLAAMAHFWDRPVTMEQIADAICYDGTYDHGERAWALANGFFVREFTVTLEAARQLISLKVPFALRTVEVGSAHAQAVIGYDLLRETLFIQDPSEPHYREIEAAEFLENYKLTGPQGMVMVPPEQAGRINALNLPDSGLYDINHRFISALAEYDREAAAAALKEMEQLAPEHRLVLIGRMSLANFDGNEVERLHGIDRLLEKFPGDPRLVHWKNAALRSMGRRAERLQLLREAVKEDKAPVTLYKNLVDVLMEDARDWDEARLLAWRVHARMAGDAGSVVSLAEMLRRTQRAPVEEWLTFHRFAASLADKVENVVQTWFAHAQTQGNTEKALEWLRQRWRRYGARSGGPALTLAQALDSMCLPEAVDVMRAAVQSRPDDGELLIQLSRIEARLGEQPKAWELLRRAEGRCSPGQWLRACAALHRRFGDHASEMAVWRQILEKEPLALDAHAWLVRELAATRGQKAALGHLAEVCARFPHHHDLAQLHIRWLREEDSKLAEKEARRVAALHPEDPWAWRELALILRDAGRAEEAAEPARQAVEVAPDQASSHGVLGLVLAGCKREKEAVEHLQAAIRLDVNFPASFEGLLSLCVDTAAKREGLAFIRREMIRQVLNGNALHAYRELAFTVLSQEELLAELREIWQARPDLWEAWSVLLAQMIDSGHKHEAVLLAQEAVQKFALTPGSWRDMALVWRALERPDAAIACARHVVNLNPDWTDGWCLLAECLEDNGQGKEAAEELLRARTRLPLDMTIRRALALLFWQTERRDEAWQLAESAVKEDPGQNWAWACMQSWAETLRKRDRLIEAATHLTETRPDEARSWLTLAKLLPLAKISAILSALEHATRLNPWLLDAWDYRMEILAQLGRLDEAMAVPAKGPWGNDTPYTVQGRLAWLRAVRGNVPEAMRQMRTILDRHRDYYWGWEMYSQWAEQSSEWTALQQAATEMVRLAPRSPGAYCAAADAALRLGKREEGIQFLKQALHVAPSSPYAAERLLGLYWEKRDVEGLRAAAALLPGIGQPALISRVYLMLAAASKDDVEQVRKDLSALAVHPDMMGGLLQLILDYFTDPRRKFALMLDQALNAAAESNTLGPAFAMLWVHREAQNRRWQCWSRLAEWLPRLGDRLDPAISLYLALIGEAQAAKPHVINFIQACEAQLRQRGEIWGKVSYALARSGEFQACADWLEPDYLRDDAEGWVLWNLAVSQRELLRPERAEEVCMHVVSHGIRDSTWNMHSVIAALGCAWKEDYDQALLLLKDTDINDDVESPVRLPMYITRALCEVMTKPAAAGRERYRKFLADCNQYFLKRAVSLQAKRDFERAMRIMREHTGASVLPWQQPKPRTEAMPQTRGRTGSWEQRPASGGGFSRAAFVCAVIFSINMLRHCGSSTTPSRTPMYELPSRAMPYTPPSESPGKSPGGQDLEKRLEDLLRRSQTLPAPLRQ